MAHVVAVRHAHSLVLLARALELDQNRSSAVVQVRVRELHLAIWPLLLLPPRQRRALRAQVFVRLSRLENAGRPVVVRVVVDGANFFDQHVGQCAPTFRREKAVAVDGLVRGPVTDKVEVEVEVDTHQGCVTDPSRVDAFCEL